MEDLAHKKDMLIGLLRIGVIGVRYLGNKLHQLASDMTNYSVLTIGKYGHFHPAGVP